MKKGKLAITTALGLIAVSPTLSALAATISGAGGTLPYALYSAWANKYEEVSGTSVSYQSIGSGGGIAQIKAKTVTFGATDVPIKNADLNRSGLAQFPTVIYGVVPVVNVPGIGAGKLLLDGGTLADIFLGKIKHWNDPAIKALNPGLVLPDRVISVVHRSDGSGTTYVFTTYLSHNSATWSSSVRAANSVDWPTGIGGKGNEGVASQVAQTAGSIGYVELDYAVKNHLSHVRLRNREGIAVTPSVDTIEAAASQVNWKDASQTNFDIVPVDQRGERSWPIVGMSYVVMYKAPVDRTASRQALRFFNWSLTNGRETARSLGYAPLPDSAMAAFRRAEMDCDTPPPDPRCPKI